MNSSVSQYSCNYYYYCTTSEVVEHTFYKKDHICPVQGFRILVTCIASLEEMNSDVQVPPNKRQSEEWVDNAHQSRMDFLSFDKDVEYEVEGSQKAHADDYADDDEFSHPLPSVSSIREH